MKHGLLLINLGTPDSTAISSVRSYLSEFLTDKRVVDLPALVRYLLVYIFILPFRSKRSAEAYRSIWTDNGSPLLHHSNKLLEKLQNEVGSEYAVALGMRYGSPSLETALESLKSCQSISILPLYPQYSSAASGSSIEQVLHIISSWEVIPSIHIIRDFFKHHSYISAQSQMIKSHLPEKTFLLFSYHGIPERQIIKSGCNSVCKEPCPTLNDDIQGCYRAQCYQTSTFIAQNLGLSEQDYSTAFQSRLGKTPWIKPYTDEVLVELIRKGIKKIAIACPSFVSDCLETLEEMGIRARQQWMALGGEELLVIPCLNAEPLWIKALTEITNMQSNIQSRRML